MFSHALGEAGSPYLVGLFAGALDNHLKGRETKNPRKQTTRRGWTKGKPFCVFQFLPCAGCRCLRREKKERENQGARWRAQSAVKSSFPSPGPGQLAEGRVEGGEEKREARWPGAAAGGRK